MAELSLTACENENENNLNLAMQTDESWASLGDVRSGDFKCRLYMMEKSERLMRTLGHGMKTRARHSFPRCKKDNVYFWSPTFFGVLRPRIPQSLIFILLSDLSDFLQC